MRRSAGRYALASIACGLVLLAAFAAQWWLGRTGHSLGGPGMLVFSLVAAGLWIAITRGRGVTP